MMIRSQLVVAVALAVVLGHLRVTVDAHDTTDKSTIISPQHGKLCRQYNWTGRLWKEAMPKKSHAARCDTYVGKSAPRSFFMHSDLRSVIRNSAFPLYKEIAADERVLLQSPCKDTIAFLGPGVVDENGVLFEDTGCLAAANGACFFANAPHVPTTDTETPGQGAASSDTFVHPPDVTATHDYVVTVAVPNGREIYHSIMECLASVIDIMSSPFATRKQYYLHVQEKTPYLMQWIAIVLPEVPTDRIVTGTIRALQQLVVPRMHCGETPGGHLLSLRTRLRAWLQKHRAQHNVTSIRVRRDAPTEENMARTSPRPVLVKRTKSRVVDGWDNLHAIADMNELSDATKAVMPVAEQIALFDTKLVIAPHGAGLLNMLSARDGACVVEIHPAGRRRTNLCFGRMAYLLGFTYVGFILPNITEDSTALINDTIHKFCLE
eukprot:m.742512 g.742512  ORF g.742512 m.742512 type:complete len:435 (-) comp23118_c0_seq32:289-1593(-)